MSTIKSVGKTAVIIAAVLLAVGPLCFAEQSEANAPQNFFEMPLETLMDVKIVSASRQSQTMSELSAPVSVITHDDIHYSGLTNIPEILQFTPGVDVLKLSRFRYAVGVRGLHEFTSDRTLVLINGRSAESALFGGTAWGTLPVLMEDIERIEVVRGPGGAAWGANAFNGVINIITKKPEDVLGTFGSTTITEFGDSYTHLRVADKKDKWSWRVSAGYEDLKNSDDAGAGRYASNTTATVNALMGFSSFTANDFSRNWRFDSEAIYRPSDETKLSFGTGYSHTVAGDWEFGGYYPGGNGWYEEIRPYIKLEHDFENGSSGYLQWSGTFDNSTSPTLMKWFSMQNNIEGQLDFEVAEVHKITMGGDVRFIQLDTELQNPRQLTYSGEPYEELLAGAFLIDHWTLTDRFALESQIRIERYSETQTDWSARMTALYAMDETKDHMLRFSFAKAFRTPFTSVRETETHRVPFPSPPYPPGLYAFNVLPADDLKNEEIYSLEAGYTGKLTKNLLLRADTFYQRYEKLIGYAKTYVGPIPYNTPENIDGADAYGAELELVLAGKPGKISAWYAYEDFRKNAPQRSIRSYAPAKHKVGLSGRLFLSDGWTFNTNYRYTTITSACKDDSTLVDVGPSHRLDLGLAKELAKGNGEVMVGVSDLFNKTEDPHFGSGQLSAHETPGRTFFARLQLKF